MERLSNKSPWYPFVSVDPERLGGKPVFRGTRVPIKSLFDYLKGGYDLPTFLDHFEGVPRELAVAVLELACGDIEQELNPNEGSARPLRPATVRSAARGSRGE